MDFLLSLFASNPYVPWIAAALVLLIAYQRLSPRLKFRLPGTGITADAVIGTLLGPRYKEAKVERWVKRFKKQGNYLAAGRLYEEAKKLAEAVDAYIEGKEFWAAASVLERMGKGERAAELYLHAGDHKKAAQVFTAVGKPVKAAALFHEKGNNLEAARLYGVAGQWDKAADLYTKGGYPLRAAEAYEKRGDFRKAAECHERHFMEHVSYSTTYSSTAPSKDQKSALIAGQLYEKAGDLGRALQIYDKGAYFREAAAVCMSLRQFDKAAELFMRAEDPASAAQAYEQKGDRVKAANLRGEVALKADQIPEAAAYFQQGQDYLRAAELFESVGMLAEAAGAFEAADSHAAAGGVYIRAGLKDCAAVSYEKAGEFETAARLYEESGNVAKAIELFERAGFTFKSGEAAARAGDHDRAIALLQRVGPSDENHRAATEILARLFVESGRPGLAVERVQRVLAGQPMGPSNLGLHYWLAFACEASGKSREALELYKKIQAEDLRYRDVERRVSQLEAGLGAAAAAQPPAARPSISLPNPASTGGVRAAPVPDAMTPTAPTLPRPATSPPPPAPPAAASRTPRFFPKEELGRGPLGTLFRGEDRDGRSVALRALPNDLIASSGVFPAVVADLKAASQLSHPNVVKVLGLIALDGRRCVVMEYVRGRNLADALKAGVRMNFQQVHGLGRVLAHALSAIHGRRLVHGSLQPSNIMVASGVVKLADLGLGRLAHTLARAESYRAPESRLDVAGDLYALAAVLYQLLTGCHPRSQPQGAALPLPSKLASGIPEAFDKLLLRCLHPREELRYASAVEIFRELKDMMRIG